MARSNSYSRISWVEEKRLKRKAVVTTLISLCLLLVFGFWGVPAIPRILDILMNPKPGQVASKIDKIPPPPPSLVQTPLATNSATLVVWGISEPQSKVVIYLNHKAAAETLAGQDGSFKSRNLSLIDKENSIYVQAEDAEGNRSQPSGTYPVFLDQKAPEIAIDRPGDGDTFTGPRHQYITISGKISKISNLTLNDRFVLVSDDLSFNTSVMLTLGDNDLNFSARDAAGNQTSKSIKVRFEP